MKRWIVNPKMRSVRECKPTGPWDDRPCADEFLYDAPTYADAMAAGQRRRLAEEALAAGLPLVRGGAVSYTIVWDRIEAQESRYATAESDAYDLGVALRGLGFDVWREGTGLVVLGRLP